MSARRLALLLALLLTLAVAAGAAAREWSWLGVRIRDLSEVEMDELAKRHGIREGFGVMIVEVIDGAPAARAGLQRGDVVVAVEDRPVTDTRVLQRFIAAIPPERESRLTVLRPEGRRALPVRLVTMPREVAGERVAVEFGFILRDAEAPPETGGARTLAAGVPSISSVIRGSAAEKAGLEVGDVILQINDRAVVSRDAVRDALAEVGFEGPLRLTVRRGERHVGLTVATPTRIP